MRVSILTALLMLALVPAGAQGCSQCREAVGQTPLRTQAAYRRGIVVLMAAGFAVFGVGLMAIRRVGR